MATLETLEKKVLRGTKVSWAYLGVRVLSVGPDPMGS